MNVWQNWTSMWREPPRILILSNNKTSSQKETCNLHMNIKEGKEWTKLAKGHEFTPTFHSGTYKARDDIESTALELERV